MKSLKRIFIIALLALISSAIYAQEFVNPIGFVDNEANRQKVIAFIKKQASVEPALKEIGEAAMIRHQMKQLDAFKELIKIKNTKLLEQIIKSSCSMGMCNYLVIITRYKRSDSNYHPPLEW